MDAELTVSRLDRLAAPRVERCERCGLDVVLVDLLAVVLDIARVTPSRPTMGANWQEIHRRPCADAEAPGGELEEVHWRPHTPERCTRARAGDPEPVAWPSLGDDDVDDG
jgi:hypothetical protein